MWIFNALRRQPGGYEKRQSVAKVTLELDDGTVYGETGELQFTDVNVDPSTGAVNVRALFKNKDASLLPGMFVRAKGWSALMLKTPF